MQLTTGYWLSRSLHVVASLGVADALGDSPQTVEALASSVGANAGALARVLRLLAAHGVFEAKDGKYAHTPASQLLRQDHPQSMRAFVQVTAVPIAWASYGQMEHAVRTGEPAADKVSPGGLFKHLADHPDEARIFDAAMVGKAHSQIPGILGAYDFSGLGVIGDIAGGRGHLLRAVLEAAPNAKGVLFELPHVIGSVEGTDRLTLQAGDFFKDALPKCDAYLLMQILHDWHDKEAKSILEAIHRAAAPGARLLVMETLIPEDSGPHWGKLLDIQMLTMHTGRERTRAEYESLIASAGFRFERVIETRSDVSIIEAVRS